MKKTQTHYENLKITRDAPEEVIRAAYKALAQKYHPDKNPGNAHAVRIMAIINEAYVILSDPEKRKEHDKWIDQHIGKNSTQNESSQYTNDDARYRSNNDSINLYDEDGYTPLMRAVKEMDVNAVRHLIAMGANPKLKDGNFGTSTALIIASLLLKRAKDFGARTIYKDIVDILKPIT